MTLTDYVSQYAPDLADIARQLEGFDALLAGYSAGPQKPDAPEQRQADQPTVPRARRDIA